MISNEADEIIKKVFDFYFRFYFRYWNNLELMRGSGFVFNYVQLLYYKYHEINLNHVYHIKILPIG